MGNASKAPLRSRLRLEYSYARIFSIGRHLRKALTYVSPILAEFVRTSFLL